MEGFLKEYATHLRQLSKISHHGLSDRVEAALNGEAQEYLEKGSSLTARRDQGAFFTGHKLREMLLENASKKDAPFYDPTCGAGDLLVEAAKKLPIKRTLEQTLVYWGNMLWGTDIDQSFVQCAKLRLYLLARKRHGNVNGGAVPRKLFPDIKTGDATEANTYYNNARTIILNPPFGKQGVSKDYELAQGSTHRAGVFSYYSIRRMSSGARILAILPDALRTGTLSSHWREFLEQNIDVKALTPYGVFDDSADINVFLIDATKQDATSCSPVRWFGGCGEGGQKVGDYFSVSVGSIVPYRHVSEGDSYSYLFPKNAPVWGEVKSVAERIYTKSKVVKGPFVAIRRTSRVEQPNRAAGTLIKGRGYFAVENHLLVCKPFDGTLKTCKMLMRQLQSEQTNNTLNNRICCRHLTVPSIKDLPFRYHDC